MRGLYPSELDEEGAYAIGRAYVEQFEPRRIAVGRDMRLSSPTMAEALIDGRGRRRRRRRRLGMVGTEMVYFAVGELGLDGGVMVTASHNPKRVHRDEDRAARRAAGRKRVGAATTCATAPCAASGASATRGTVDARGRLGRLRRPRALVRRRRPRSRRCASSIDAANGMAGAMLPPVLARLPQVDAVRCYFEPDGSFPNHEPNPLLPENREFIVGKTTRGGRRLRRRLRRRRRPLLLRRRHAASSSPATSRPRSSPSRSSRRSRGGKVIYDVRASWAVPEAIARRRRRAARQPRRPLVHQAADARRGRGVRRRGVGALLLPRLLAGRLGRDPVPADARARLDARPAAERDPRAVPVRATSSPARSTRRSPTSR